jgi:hypothetical protein
MNPRTLLQAVVFLCATTVAIVPQSPAPASHETPPLAKASLPQDANQYIRQAILHEIAEEDRDQSHWRYRFHRDDDRNNYDRDVIETKEGQLARTLLFAGRPLTAEQLQQDEDRMRKLVSDPEERAKRIKREKDDTEKARRLLKAIPDAFTFKYDGEEEGMVRLSFVPAPHYSAPTRELQVFRVLSGKLWIDRSSSRLAGIDGALFEDVTFGFGLLGRLNKGGTFKISQRQVAPDHWELVALELNLSGHAIIFKTISIKQRQTFSDFQRVSDSLTMAEAFQILQRDASAASANNDHAAPHPQGKD